MKTLKGLSLDHCAVKSPKQEKFFLGLSNLEFLQLKESYGEKPFTKSCFAPLSGLKAVNLRLMSLEEDAERYLETFSEFNGSLLCS